MWRARVGKISFAAAKPSAAPACTLNCRSGSTSKQMKTSLTTQTTFQLPNAQLIQAGGASGRRMLSLFTRCAALCGLLVGNSALPIRADQDWDGDNSVGNFSYNNNWYGNTQPSWSADANLVFHYNNGGASSIYDDYGGWVATKNMYYASTYPRAMTLSGAGQGIDIHCRLENNSSFEQTINIPLSMKGDRDANNVQINPVNGNLVLSGNLYNDNAKDLNVYGANGKMLRMNTAWPNNNYGVKLLIQQNSIVNVAAPQNYTDETDINAGEFWVSTGGSLSTSRIYVGNSSTPATSAKLWLHDGGVSSSTPITVNSGNSGSRTIGGLNNSGTVTFNGTITLSGPVNLEANQAGGTVSFATISGASVQTVTANGPGTVVLGGTADNQNLAAVASSGTLVMGKTSSSGVHAVGSGLTVNSGAKAQLGGSGGDQIYDSATVTVGSGGVFDLNGQSETCGSVTLNGTGIGSGGALVNNNSSAGSTLNSSVTLSAASSVGGSGSLTIAGAIGGGYSLTKVGAGTVTLTGANNYTGSTAVQGGTVVISGGDDRLPAGTTLTLGTGTSSGLLQLGDSNGARNQTLARLLTSGSGGANRVVGGNASTSTLTINASGDCTYSGYLGGTSPNQNSLALLKTGNANLNLEGANTFSGGATIRAGALVWRADTALGTGAVTLNDVGTGSNATSLLGDTSGTNTVAIIVANQGSGTTTIGNGSSSAYVGYAGGLTLNRSVTLQGASSGATRFITTGISGPGGITIVGPKTVTFFAANTYTGDTRLSSGTLLIGDGNALQNSTLDLNSADLGTAGWGAGVTSLTLGGLKGTRDWNQDTVSVAIGNNSQDTTYSGRLGGTMSLSKIGGGKLTLSGASGYSGDTAVSSGTLAFSGSGSINSSRNITISSGATLDLSAATGGSYSLANNQTLKGTGAVNGNLVVASGASVAPGTSIGTLTFASGNLTFNTGSALGVEVDRGASPSADKIQGIGTLTEGGTLYVTNSGSTLQVNDSFTLLSAATYGGEFAAISPASPNGDTELAWDKPALKSSGILRVHHVPFATSKTLVRAKGMTAKFKLSDLFPSPDPLDSDTVVLESFTAGSQGATITSNATYMFYVPANNNNDAFDYTVTDSRGAKRTRTITVNVGATGGQAQQITVVNGKATVNFAGIPGYTYQVERADDANFTVNLTTVLTTTLPTGGDGLFTFVDNSPPGSQAYYRLNYNP
jgi:autotransporter-associated beta strand protein